MASLQKVEGISCFTVFVLRMIDGREWVSRKRCSLTVITLRHYQRTMRGKQSGIPWKPTRPNIPYTQSSYFYAATGIVGELSELSIGIGTAVPFQVAGAPGLDAYALVREFSRRRLTGVSFSPVQWKPSRGVYAGRTCMGVQIHFKNVGSASLTRLNFELMDAVRAIQPTRRFLVFRAPGIVCSICAAARRAYDVCFRQAGRPLKSGMFGTQAAPLFACNASLICRMDKA